MNLYSLGALLSGILGSLQGVLVGRASKAGGLQLTVASLSLTQALVPIILVAVQGRSGLPIDWRWPLIGGALAGLIGTATLTLNGLAINQLGAATTFVVINAGLIIASLVMDHLGWSGVTKNAFDPMRLLGVALVLGGIWLISRR